MQVISLNSHPSTPCEFIRCFMVRVQKVPGGVLSLDYTVQGDISELHIPGHRKARRVDDLWRHTCFEAFLKDGEGYYEFNFAPSTEWAIYHFAAYRDGMSVVRHVKPPRISLMLDLCLLRLNASIDLNGLSAKLSNASACFALSAVIEEKGGKLSYWASRHPLSQPDFHHPDSFAFELDLTDKCQALPSGETDEVRY